MGGVVSRGITAEKDQIYGVAYLLTPRHDESSISREICLALNPPLRFCRWAPEKNGAAGARRRILVTDMTARDAIWWDARVQPTIMGISDRADQLWLWSSLLPLTHLSQMAKGRRCRPLVIWTAADNGRFVRSALCIAIERYPHLDVTGPREAHFVWFLAVAPDSVLQGLGISSPASLGQVALDCAMVLSLNAGLGGRIGLHAAPGGGSRLLTYYLNTCRLLQLHSTAALPRSIKKANDGRFFYTDDPVADNLMTSFCIFR